MKTIFLRALAADDKAAVLRSAIQEPEMVRDKQRFEVDAASFSAVPRSPFAYWVSAHLLKLFKELPPFESDKRTAKVGLQTSDDFRFVRGWWALPTFQIGKRWFPFAKGGTFSPFYSDVFLSLGWRSDGYEMKAWAGSLYNNSHWSRILKNTDFFFRPGLTWPRRTQGGLSLRVMPAGCIFADKGPAAFVENNNSDRLLALLSITNSRVFNALVDLQMAFGSYEVGVIQRTPIPSCCPGDLNVLAARARRAWSLKRCLDTRTETSHAFTLPALLQVKGDTLAMRAGAWAEHILAIETEFAKIQAEIDARCFDLYGIAEADRRAITEGYGSTTASGGTTETETDTDAESESDVDDEGEAQSDADTTSLVAELVSWAVGVAFGRFDVRLASGTRALPPEPEPFDPLPVCSPAMLTGGDGLPLASAPSGYSLAFPENGILMDDPGHPHDLTTAVRAVFDVVFGARADAIWREAAALLDPKDHDLRAWLSASFFEYHLKRHSKSRRKAPILWQLGVPSGRYSVWLYAHRLTRDSFFQIQNDVVALKLVHEERQLTSFVQHARGSLSTRERKEIATQEAFVDELRALLDEVKRVTLLWTSTLDDGVVLTMAPLWRLVPQYKPWQKELKGKWDELSAGKYDWAHLAMHLWPERIVPNCATDRSLAIAHELEDVFWVEDANGKWQQRATSTRPVEEIVHERSSLAVKATLKTLSDALAITTGARRGSTRVEISA